MTVNRRSFLKKSLTGSVALTVGCAGLDKVVSPDSMGTVWADNFQVNPSIDNKKVVCCHDASMIENVDDASTFQKQNNAVVTTRTENNMDTMAKRLTGKSSADQAWTAIFRKPESKAWGNVKVAVKVNGINSRIMPRIAIVGKVCKELGKLGVAAGNITVYDACSGAAGSGKYTPYIGDGLPEGTVVSNGDRSGTVQIGDTRYECTTVVTRCDILVNCAVNKGHGSTYGGFTMTMKNHTGTMKFRCPSQRELIDENKSDLILGGSPVRQQLCIVDSLWAAVPGPGDPSTHIPGRIVMGTFSPLVDVAVARKIREPVMGASHSDSAIENILAAFGYAESDLEWDEFSP